MQKIKSDMPNLKCEDLMSCKASLEITKNQNAGGFLYGINEKKYAERQEAEKIYDRYFSATNFYYCSNYYYCVVSTYHLFTDDLKREYLEVVRPLLIEYYTNEILPELRKIALVKDEMPAAEVELMNVLTGPTLIEALGGMSRGPFAVPALDLEKFKKKVISE